MSVPSKSTASGTWFVVTEFGASDMSFVQRNRGRRALTSGGILESCAASMRSLVKTPWLTFGIFVLWKLVLILFTAQPIPFNDAFFYDGAVVNYLLHGHYSNPSLSMVLPISGNEVFSAYPPLHQVAMLGWMSVFGTSVLASMYFHLTLLMIYGVTVLAIFRRFNVQPTWVNFACMFLFSITWHDRPDTLANVFGVLALYSLVRGWSVPAAAFLLMTFGTSLQLGGIYFLWLALFVFTAVYLKQLKCPWLAVVLFFISFFGLIGLVKFGFPHLWDGFREHVKVTPSVTGLRIPSLDELLKVMRNGPGVLAVVVWLIVLGLQKRGRWLVISKSRVLQLALAGAIASSALMFASLFYLMPNTVYSVNYLQPIIVGCFLAALGESIAEQPVSTHKGDTTFTRRSAPVGGLVILGIAVLIIAVRGFGMTIWGLMCSSDMDQKTAINIVRAQTASLPAHSTVVASSAYLYEVARRADTRFIHADWVGLKDEWTPGYGIKELGALRPERLILTQFDFYRRYDQVLAELRSETNLVLITVHNRSAATVPDSIFGMRRLVQHVSWNPVVIDFVWRNPAE
jgi:hypothetical protein